MTVQHHIDNAKHIADVAAGSAIVATWLDMVPKISAVVALLYLLVRLYETNTVQALIARMRKK